MRGESKEAEVHVIGLEGKVEEAEIENPVEDQIRHSARSVAEHLARHPSASQRIEPVDASEYVFVKSAQGRRKMMGE